MEGLSRYEISSITIVGRHCDKWLAERGLDWSLRDVINSDMRRNTALKQVRKENLIEDRFDEEFDNV